MRGGLRGFPVRPVAVGAGDDRRECRTHDLGLRFFHAWERRAWARVNPDDAYVRLLSRSLFARELAIRARVREAPPWLWPGAAGRLVSRLVHVLFEAGALNFVRHARDRARDPGRIGAAPCLRSEGGVGAAP